MSRESVAWVEFIPPLAQGLHELVLRLNIPACDNFEYDVLSR